MEKHITDFIEFEKTQTTCLNDEAVLAYVMRSDRQVSVFWPFIHGWANASVVAACVVAVCFGVWFAKISSTPAEQLLVVNNVHLENVEYIVGGE